MKIDNVMIAYEVGHFLHCKNKGFKGWVALKLDMAKACDQIEWTYVKSVLDQIGFSPLWIKWMIMCISSVNYAICTSGKNFGSIMLE